MNTQNNIYIFVEKNMGHGFETIYPILSRWYLFLLRCLIKTCKAGLSKRCGFLMYHKVEIDQNCPDPRAKGRSPQIEMTAVFPWKFDENHLFSEAGNNLLKECWSRALAVSSKGQNSQMTLELPEIWYKQGNGGNK